VIPTFVIFLREGIEASMIVTILLAYLVRINKRQHFRDVWIGVGAAFVLVLGGGVAAYFLIKQYEGSNVQTYFETATYVMAAAVLTYMTFWMHKHARTMAKDLERRSEIALTRGSRTGLSLLAFQAVGREGLETMVFTLAIIFASSRQAATPVHGNLLLVGAVLGLLCALAIAFAIFKLGAKLNMRRFFQVLGIVLMVFAAGLLSDAVENLQQLRWLPFGTHVMWNSSGLITESSSFGDVLHSLVGYADRPTVLQVVVWIAYVVTSIALFVHLGRDRRPATPPRATPDAAPAKNETRHLPT
jgi:high-affinity iron transporter